ncbi:MAG: hypothetical protein ABII13_00600 [Patescibacteria group bacterium]|nr:hypothetical protein [Patescibacteria group bacterium]MBU2508783.1 hypothetical protein [Patescibacteria group bacterium]
MNTPKPHIRYHELEDAVGQHVQKHFQWEEDEPWSCKKCGRELRFADCVIHPCVKEHGRKPESNEPCSGGGPVRRFALPYCPECEVVPKDIVHTCAFD